MIKHKYVRIVLCSLLVGMCLCHESAQSQQADSDRLNRPDVGREDPFAKLPRKKTLPPIAKKISAVTIVDENKPELFIETITLKYLDAKSLKAVINSLCSEYGTISDDTKTNSLIICDRKENLDMILTQIKRADNTTTPQQTVIEEAIKPGLFVETVTLKFLDAKNLKEAIGGMSSKYGSISIDGKSNSLIICDTNDVLEMILAEVRKADKTPRQIMIEAVILDVQLDDEEEIGVNWDLLSNERYDLSYRQKLGSRLSSTAESAATIGDTTAFNTAGIAGAAGGYLAVISGTVRNTIHLLQNKKDVEILASPKVMVVSGETASFETVTELPYREVTETSMGGELASTDFKRVGIKLNVTATLTDDNYILLTVTPEQNVNTGEFGTDSDIPIIDTRTVTTTLLLKDGELIVISGLRKKETTNQVSQIPLLGDLPLVGALFRNTQKVVKNSELLVLLSPHIYKGEPVPDDVLATFNKIKDRPMLKLPNDKNDD